MEEVYLARIGDVSTFTPAKYNKSLKMDLGGCKADPVTLAALTYHRMKFQSNIVRPECTTQETKKLLDILNGETPWDSLMNLEIGEISEDGCKALSYILQYTNKCKSLRLVKISRTKMALITERLSRDDHCVALEDLSIVNTDLTSTTETQWKQLFEAKTKISHLTFTKSTLLCDGNKSIFSQPHNTYKQLKGLDISECSLGTNAIQQLNKFLIASPHLKNVTVKYSGDVSGLTPSQYSDKLETLDFEGCTSNPYTLGLMVERSFKSKIQTFPSSSTKDGKKIEDLYNGTLKWSDLKHLDIGKMSEEGCRAFSVIFKYTKVCRSLKLKEVNGTNMKLITESLSKSELCDALEELSVTDTDLSLTTETQWKQLFEVKNKLSHLTFSKCKLFCKSSKSIFSQARNKNLKVLRISRCCLSSEDINRFLVNSPQLINVSVKHSGNVSGITPAKYSKNMETLDFEGCTANPYTLALLAQHSMTSTVKVDQVPNCSTEDNDGKYLVDIYNGKRKWPELEDIDINNISEEGCKALPVILQHTKACKSFTLNKITGTILQNTTEILSNDEHCASLEQLHVIQTDLSSTSEQQWKQLFRGKAELSLVVFSECKLLCEGNISIFRQAVSMCKHLKHLDISGCSLSTTEVEHLNNYLMTLTNLARVSLKCAGDVSGLTPDQYSDKLKTLDFEGSTGNPFTLALLAEHCMKSSTNIKNFPRCSTKDGEKLVDMYNGTTTWSDIEHLVIDDSITPSGGQALGLILGYAKGLKAIHLTESQCYSGEAVANIFKEIQNSLETISFHGCKMNLEEQSFEEITKRVENFSQLKMLHVGHCSSSYILIELMNKLKHSKVLEDLDFSQCKCDSFTLKRLGKHETELSAQIRYKPPIHNHEIAAQRFQKLLTLSEPDFKKQTEIDLSSFQITKDSLISIRNVLEKTTSLRKFILANCTMCEGVVSKDSPFQDVLKQLIKLKNLEILDLSGIEIENKSIETLKTIPHQTKWTELYLNKSNVPVIKSLLSILKEKCPHLTKLHLQGISLTVKDLEVLISLIKECPIVDLNISESNMEHKRGKYLGLKTEDKFLDLLKEIERSKSESNKKTINISENFDAKYIKEKIDPIIKDSFNEYILWKEETKV